MGRPLEGIDAELAEFCERQPVYFVATAPSGSDGHVNLSPKGYDSLRVIDPHTVAYLDLTGSGIETIAHLRENGRITIMLCAFEGPPQIVRLQGRGEVVLPGEADFDGLIARFPATPGVRSVIRVALDRVSSSCGFGVPLMTFAGERDRLREWADGLGPERLESYRSNKNAISIDGLPGLPD